MRLELVSPMGIKRMIDSGLCGVHYIIERHSFA
jgi:hypothetical protein